MVLFCYLCNGNPEWTSSNCKRYSMEGCQKYLMECQHWELLQWEARIVRSGAQQKAGHCSCHFSMCIFFIFLSYSQSGTHSELFLFLSCFFSCSFTFRHPEILSSVSFLQFLKKHPEWPSVFIPILRCSEHAWLPIHPSDWLIAKILDLFCAMFPYTSSCSPSFFWYFFFFHLKELTQNAHCMLIPSAKRSFKIHH